MNGVSVVIPTLGGDTLADTIARINRGTLVPDEILVCIPNEYLERASGIKDGNVSIIGTDKRGQVAQRAAGFQTASGEIVVQIDDDVYLDMESLRCLVTTLQENGPKVSVGPLIYDIRSKDSQNSTPGRAWRNALYGLISNGSLGCTPGGVTKSGFIFGVYSTETDKRVIEVDWLAGGCVAHYRSNLVKDDFYPLPGKAYCEDLFHSFLLKRKGIRFLMDTDARCGVELENIESYGIKEYYRFLRDDSRARKTYVAMSGRSVARMYFVYFTLLIRHAARRLLLTSNLRP